MFISVRRERIVNPRTLNTSFVFDSSITGVKKYPYSPRSLVPLYKTRTVTNVDSNSIIYSPFKKRTYSIIKKIPVRSYSQNNSNASSAIRLINSSFKTKQYSYASYNPKNIYKINQKSLNKLEVLTPYQNRSLAQIPKLQNYSRQLPQIVVNDYPNFGNATETKNFYTKPEYNYTSYDSYVLPKQTIGIHNNSGLYPTDFSTRNYDYVNNYLEPPENFDPNEFELTQLIGVGGFSHIFSCKWRRNGKRYVLKKLVSHETRDIENERRQAKVVIDFIKATGCDGVIKVYGERIIPQSNSQCILMEYANNDWENEIQQRKAMYDYYSEYELTNIMKQLINTFALLERYNITHRDIKPKNILIANGKYKISDFSDSKVIPEGRSELSVRGTELFMSPLLVKAYHQNVPAFHDSYKSDVYSFGMCILYAAGLSTSLMDAVRSSNDDRKRMGLLWSKLGNRYSVNLVKLIYLMVHPDERRRPNFVQLETMI